MFLIQIQTHDLYHNRHTHTHSKMSSMSTKSMMIIVLLPREKTFLPYKWCLALFRSIYQNCHALYHANYYLHLRCHPYLITLFVDFSACLSVSVCYYRPQTNIIIIITHTHTKAREIIFAALFNNICHLFFAK